MSWRNKKGCAKHGNATSASYWMENFENPFSVSFLQVIVIKKMRSIFQNLV